MSFTRLFDLLPYCLEKYNKEDALACKKAGKWVTYSQKEYVEMSDLVSYALLELGIQKDDKIATINNNRPEWNFVDMGMMQIGAIHAPLYQTINDNDLIEILNETECKIIFVSNKYLYNKVRSVQPSLKYLEKIYTFDKVEESDHFDDLIELGRNNPEHEKVESLKASISPDDLATIIYTSGTSSSTPKGVMLTHNNLVQNVKGCNPILIIRPSERALSLMPVCHIGERMNNYLYQYTGLSIYYAESMAGILDNFREVKPNVMVVVPLLLEKIYENFVAFGEKLPPDQKQKFDWALNLALEYEPSRINDEEYMKNLKIADEHVLSKLRNFLGGNIRSLTCGGAVIQEHLLKLFPAAGIPIIDAYGLTETSPMVTWTDYGHHRTTPRNSKGQKTIEGVEFKIADDGEVICKGHAVMQGYYKKPELTQEAIDDNGWFHTGDIGSIDEDGSLKITGRKKMIFKTAAGVYVSPEKIENQLKRNDFISQALVVGANQKYLSAIIVPDFDKIKSWYEENGIEYPGADTTITNVDLLEIIQKNIDDYNSNLFESQQIRKFRLIVDEWSIEKGELTPTMKIKRTVISDKYGDLIKEFYE